MSVNIECCRCKMVFAIPQDFYNSMKQLAEKGSFYCPAGHGQHFNSGESEADILRREVERQKQNAAYLHDRIAEERKAKEAAQRSSAANRGQITKLKNRAANGVCPCCNRTFSNLQRHMAHKHPQFAKVEAAA